MACDKTSICAILSLCDPQSLRFYPAPAWILSIGCHPSGKNLLHHGPSRGCRGVCSGTHSSSDLGAHRAHFSHFFSSQLCSFPLLKSVTTEAPPALVMGLAGTDWNQLCQAWGSPDCFSQCFPPTPGHGHLIHQVSGVLASFKITSLPSPADTPHICTVGYPGIWR